MMTAIRQLLTTAGVTRRNVTPELLVLVAHPAETAQY